MEEVWGRALRGRGLRVQVRDYPGTGVFLSMARLDLRESGSGKLVAVILWSEPSTDPAGSFASLLKRYEAGIHVPHVERRVDMFWGLEWAFPPCGSAAELEILLTAQRGEC